MKWPMQSNSKRRLLGVLMASMMLSSCMDLATNESKNKQATSKHIVYSDGQVYTMRGLGGIFSRGMNRLEDNLEFNHQVRTSSTIWYKAHELSDFIAENHKNGTLKGPIILIGHSLGANEQIKVAKYLEKDNVSVDLLLTVDAVAPITVPSNVKEVLNIYKPALVPMFSGLKLKAADPQRTHINNFNVTTIKEVSVNHFTIDKNNKIQEIMLEKVLATIRKANKV